MIGRSLRLQGNKSHAKAQRRKEERNMTRRIPTFLHSSAPLRLCVSISAALLLAFANSASAQRTQSEIEDQYYRLIRFPMVSHRVLEASALEYLPDGKLAVATRRGAQIVGISRQWTIGSGPRPYRYGGAVGPVSLTPAVDTALRSAAEKISAALALVGLVSFDFILAGETSFLLEVNPRPSATLDVFDDADGSLFRAHLDTCAGRTPRLPSTNGARAAAILYADRGPLRVGEVAWPEWAADRPDPGIRVPRHRPIATVFAREASPEAALHSVRQRLDELREMLYAQAPNREPTNNAEVQRSSPERLGTRSQAR